jgi:trans-aconitate methyltransferase
VGRAPERLAWALELLSPRPRDHVLEIGAGSGVAAELLLADYPSVKLTAIDRSPTAIAACKRRLGPFIEAGRANVVRSELARFSPPCSFNRAFAVNVNSFWVNAGQELEALARLLSPGGALVLVFDPPSAKQSERIASACSEGLREQGFARIQVTWRSTLVALRALRQR